VPTDIRDALTAYTEDPPPPAFSFDGILATGRRRRRTRRLAGGGVLLVLALGVALTLPSFLPAPIPYASPTVLDTSGWCATASAAPTGPTVAPTSVVNEKNGYRIRIPVEPAVHAAARMSCYLGETVPPLLPGAALSRDPSDPVGIAPLQAYPARVFDPARPAETSPPTITASAVVTDKRGTGTIGFGAIPSTETTADAARNCGPGPQCTVRTGPHGETVIVLDSTSSSGVRVVNISVYRGDTTILASASNVVLPAAPGQAVNLDDFSPGFRGLPLTVDQLIMLADTPAFDLFP
jgi:hypothetical protein